MPPPSPPKDTVDIIVERLKQSKGITMGNKNKNKIMKNNDDVIMIVQQISIKTIQETKSALRVFNIQHPHKLLGKADNQWKRACALLEFTTRKIQGIKIPLFLLAKIAKSSSMKEFEKFHDMVGNLRRSTQTKASSIPLQKSYRPRAMNNAGTTDRRTSTSTATATTTTHKNDTNSGAMTSRKQQHYSSRTSNHHDVAQRQQQQQRQRINLKKSSLPFLAIKLFAYVEDSHGVSKRAQQLLNQLMEPPSRQRQQQQQQGGGRSSAIVAAREHQQLLLDIQTHQSTYEAVCYYIVAKSYDDDNETNLTVEIMLQFTTDFTAKEFRTIHEFVSSTDAAKIILEDSQTTKMPPTESSSSSQNNIAGMKRPRRSSLRGGKQKRAKNPSTNTAADNIMNYDDNNSHEKDDTPQFSLEFLNWKEKVLKEAIQEQFQKQHHQQQVVSAPGSGGGGQEEKEKGTGDDDSSPLMLPWDKEMEALHQAASQILSKHGLLQR